jgi:hypothetical protein
MILHCEQSGSRRSAWATTDNYDLELFNDFLHHVSFK